ncbi:MAG: hypothetical protein GKS00_02365 [Alphaproteobacteria bacterium]|nr:hypothetical protein [Alphaproteobacteria bacterium]
MQQRIIRRFGLAVMTVVAGALAAPSIGAAAPQALALVATEGDTTLICEGGKCSAEFSAFCLQQDRSSPVRGTPYRLTADSAVTVTGTARDGKTITLNPATDLRFHSLRTHVAVHIAVTEATVRQHGLTAVTVAIGENVTLAPVAVLGDENPQDEAGLAAAAGPLRAVGSRIVDTNENRMAAARLTSRLINDLDANALPQTDVTQSLWVRAVGEKSPTSKAATRMARGALELCQFAVERRGIGEIKGCLQQHHDKFVDYLNGHYWKAVGAGT